jgi:hypothetical protein
MPNFLLTKQPDGRGVIYINLDAIIRADRSTTGGSLTLTLTDGSTVPLDKHHSETVAEFLDRSRPDKAASRCELAYQSRKGRQGVPSEYRPTGHLGLMATSDRAKPT